MIGIMKLKNILNTLSLAAVALVATACQDTDAQVSIEEVGAPVFREVTPGTDFALGFGEKTIQVKFDKNIGFATKNTNKITLNGQPVKSAAVNGIDSVLTIKADVDFTKIQTLVIPAGIIVGPAKHTYDQELTFTWTYPELPSNTATQMTKQLGWGWNFGNHFDTSNTQWGYWDGVTNITSAPFQTLVNVGAKTVRMPVTWTNHMDDNYVISAAYLDEVAGAVDKALAAGLNVILNTHHDSFETDLGNAAGNAEVAQKDSTIIVELWSQVATKFKDYGDKLIFETFNEIHADENWNNTNDAQTALLNAWNQYAVDAIRKTGGNNATRWIAVAGYAANIDITINTLVLPTDPANRIIVAVHCYDPYNFCLAPEASGTNSWGHNADPDHSVSNSNEQYVIDQLWKLRTTYIDKDIPCYLGEYGCVWQTTERANAFRKYYLEFFCRAANLAGIPMFVWDNNSKDSGDEANGYINHADGSWLNDSETTVPMMLKACTDSNYDWFDKIWNRSPEAN